MWSYEKKMVSDGYTHVAGVDEAGRGPLAGPVVSSAVILPNSFLAEGLTDSKKLTPAKRDFFFDLIIEKAVAVGIGIADHLEIDQLNILQASLLSMKRAVLDLKVKPDFLLVDGIYRVPVSTDQLPVKKGDSLSISIAAGSVIAKVTRDRIMKSLHLQYPEYGFNQHNGYPTKKHKEAIQIHGPAPIHRKTFRGVKEFL
jgi:ribonuclease HII